MFHSLLNYICHTILHWFQVNNIVSQYLYTLWNDHHGKSSYHLSPYRVIIILLTLFLMLYIISSCLSYFIAGSLYILLLQLFLSFLLWEFPSIHKNRENITTISDPMKSGSGNPLQYSCLENPMDRGAWRAMVHGVTKSRTQLKWPSPCTWGHQRVCYACFRFHDSYDMVFIAGIFLKKILVLCYFTPK